MIARAAMTATSPMQWKAVGRAVIAILSIRAILAVLIMWTALPLLRLLVRLPAGDEGWQPFDVFLIGRRVLRALLVVVWLRLRLRLLLVARIEGLRFARRKRFAADRRLIALALIIAVVGKVAALVAAWLVVGLALAKLLLRCGDQPEIMLGVLIIILGRDRISGTLRVAGKLKIFFGDMRGGSANFHVRPVGLIHAR